MWYTLKLKVPKAEKVQVTYYKEESDNPCFLITRKDKTFILYSMKKDLTLTKKATAQSPQSLESKYINFCKK